MVQQACSIKRLLQSYNYRMGKGCYVDSDKTHYSDIGFHYANTQTVESVRRPNLGAYLSHNTSVILPIITDINFKMPAQDLHELNSSRIFCGSNKIAKQNSVAPSEHFTFIRDSF